MNKDDERRVDKWAGRMDADGRRIGIKHGWENGWLGAKMKG